MFRKCQTDVKYFMPILRPQLTLFNDFNNESTQLRDQLNPGHWMRSLSTCYE
jgi:hypothetical protein